ncbi:hypothetical protein ACIQC7_34585 [Kitasatospora sp. NPDC088556]|uniref:hypothetical protein n=1 Tax=Kitasatospora sp. NPDC088556 TaxID=3364076 RepID=UPI00382545A6
MTEQSSTDTLDRDDYKVAFEIKWDDGAKSKTRESGVVYRVVQEFGSTWRAPLGPVLADGLGGLLVFWQPQGQALRVRDVEAAGWLWEGIRLRDRAIEEGFPGREFGHEERIHDEDVAG